MSLAMGAFVNVKIHINVSKSSRTHRSPKTYCKQNTNSTRTKNIKPINRPKNSSLPYNEQTNKNALTIQHLPEKQQTINASSTSKERRCHSLKSEVAPFFERRPCLQQMTELI